MNEQAEKSDVYDAENVECVLVRETPYERFWRIVPIGAGTHVYNGKQMIPKSEGAK